VSLPDLVELLWGVPYVRPFVMTGSLVAVVAAWAVKRRWGRSFWLGSAALVAESGLLAVTLMPDLAGTFGAPPARWESSVYSCFTRWHGSLQPVLGTSDGRANVLLFLVPAALGSMWLGRPVLVAAALTAQSIAIEFVQGVYAGSSCQLADVSANTFGSLLGLVLVLALALVRAPRPRPPRRLVADR